MGKKRGAVIRAKKRADAAALELTKQTFDNQELDQLEAKADSELFVLDTKPDSSNSSNVVNKKKRKSDVKKSSLDVKQGKKNRISEKDERQIKKLINAHSKDTIISLAAGTEQRFKQRKRVKRVAGTAKASFDLWDESNDNNAGTKLVPVNSGVKSAAGTAPIQLKSVCKTTLRKDIQQPAKLSNSQRKLRLAYEAKAQKTVKVELAQPGQSYRPDKEQHQNVIGEALSIELRRKEALEYARTPIGGGQMSEKTLALLVGSSDEESSDDEEDETMTSAVNPVKRKEKFTRAQRNKQKRLKAEQLALDERKRAKKLLNSVQNAKSIAKQIRKEESARIAKKEQIETLKAEKLSKPLGTNIIEHLSQLDPIHAPALPVALTDELKDGSLRTIKPKGSLLTDRMDSLVSRKMANRRMLEKKRVVHGKKRIKGGKGREYLLV
mmetsp:Transcript_15129/g.18435  ORF Transcript_15129/g.18435 Transcript_15129/m.18435 type:complete len:438 (+) Transcript_15129:102-1415(+)